MKLNTSAAWEDATAMISANREVLAILAGVFFLLPGLALELFLPKPIEPARGDPEAAMEILKTFWSMAAPYFVVSMLVQTFGQLAVTRLIGGRSACTVGQAMRQALIGLPILVLVQLILGLVWIITGGVLVGASAATGAVPVAVLMGLVLVGVAVWVGARLSMIQPLIAIDSLRNPLDILRRSWDLTRSNAGGILLFLLLVLVVAVVTAVAASAIGGIMAMAVLGDRGGQIAGGVISSLLSAVVTLYVTAMFAAIYRQLAGSADPQLPGVFG